MNISTLYLLLVLPVLIMAGGPKVKNITASTTEMSPGETVTVIVRLKGNTEGIENMQLIVREFPYDVAPFDFKSIDDKKNRVWEAKIPVPYESPSGNFNLELKIIMKDGSQLESEDSATNAHGKAGTLSVTVI